ncbi:MAG: hypothetical protein RL065_1773 [Bacteroidota bacterium]
MVTFSNCKINLGLQILQKRIDGFHDLDTVFIPVPLFDCVEIITSKAALTEKVQITQLGNALPIAPEQNICVKAYRILDRIFNLPPIHIYLYKKIPAGAGLGGGSANGAAVLMLLNKIFELRLTKQQLANYALALGSDCPFFIYNEPMHALGRGEKMMPIKINLSGYYLSLVNPNIQISTAAAFSEILPQKCIHTTAEIIATTEIGQWAQVLKNDFEKSVFKKFEQLKTIKHMLYSNGAVYASMSGSGSTLYGIFNKKDDAEKLISTSYRQWVVPL